MAVSQEKTNLISIIIVNYQTWQTTLSLLRSLGTDDDTEIIVIDNGPDDTLAKPLKEQFPYVRYVPLEKNVGYAKAVNEGIDKSSGTWIMVLNNDIQATILDIRKLVIFASSEKALVAAPRLVKSSGNVQDNIGYFDNCFTHLINCIFARPRLINASQIQEPTKVDLATGGAILFHKDVIKRIGNWDNRFFMYFEDIDFGLRLKSRGIPVLYVPEIKLGHLNSHTANRDPKQKIKNYDKARDKYLMKHRGLFIKILNDFLNLY